MIGARYEIEVRLVAPNVGEEAPVYEAHLEQRRIPPSVITSYPKRGRSNSPKAAVEQVIREYVNDEDFDL